MRGEKAQQSWEDTAAKRNKDTDGVRNKDKRKGKSKTRVEQTQIKQMFITEVVIDN